MNGVLYVMAILGCGDAGAECQQVRVEPVQYRSAAECNAAAAAVLNRNMNLFYPVVVADCRRESRPVIASR